MRYQLYKATCMGDAVPWKKPFVRYSLALYWLQRLVDRGYTYSWMEYISDCE